MQQLVKRVCGLVLLAGCCVTPELWAQESALVGTNVAVFYPAGFQASETLPSLALVSEPEQRGKLPWRWPTQVKFFSEQGTNSAFIATPKGASLYGTGENVGPLLRNGKTVDLWNTDNLGYRSHDGSRLYQSHPWVLCVRKDGTAFGVIADSTWRMTINLKDGIRFTSEGPAFRVFVIERESPQQVMAVLADLTGKMPLPPLWSLGYQQCRWSYYPEEKVRNLADTFREKKIPCDVIWLDIHYMDSYRIFTFSQEYFPEPKALNGYLHDRGFKSVWMIDPGVKAQPGYPVYDSGEKEGAWVLDASSNAFVGKVWPGECVFPDFTRPETRTWWAGLYSDFMAMGVDGVWNDMNEPAVFEGPDGTMPVSNIHRGGAGLPQDLHARYHNVYGMLMVQATREGVQSANPKKRPFVLTRSSYLGGHRYAATWTGDNIANWEHLKMSIPMSLNLGLSGQPFNGPDIGGFKDNSTPELFGHWIALGAFYPFCRSHKASWTKNQEPWMLGEEIEKVSRTAIERRYRLLPYLYTLFHEASQNGLPVMRPVFFADPRDSRLRSEEQVFLLGSDLLVIPKWAERPQLPRGFTHALSLAGEDPVGDAYQPEIRLRDGAILPVGPVMQSTTEYRHDPITLLVALDTKGRAEGSLYEDAGEGYGYQNNEYLFTTFTAQRKGRNVIVTRKSREGGTVIPPRTVNVELITEQGILKASGLETESIAIPF
ncbi:MAG: TIM-barrel domain-containing protein [Lentisphaerota bacterium]